MFMYVLFSVAGNAYTYIKAAYTALGVLYVRWRTAGENFKF